eukprot:jgi/Chlat1/3612/Chrsp235S03603
MGGLASLRLHAVLAAAAAIVAVAGYWKHTHLHPGSLQHQDKHTYKEKDSAAVNNAAVAGQGGAATGELSAAPEAKMTVFISYCQFDKHHAERVRRLAEQLQQNNIEVIVDYKNTYQSWPAFVGQMLNNGTKVIVACDEHYERFSLKQPTAAVKMGAGTHDEYTNILNKVYEEQNLSGWLVPVVFRPPGARKDVPAQIRKFSYFTLGGHQAPWVGYDTLVKHLKNVPAFVQPMPQSASESPRMGVLSVVEQRRHETEFTDKWRNEAQDAMDTIQAFAQTSADYYADFRAYRGGDGSPQAERLKKVEDARRYLRDFWRTTYKWHMDGMLPADFFSKSNVWCARGNSFRLMVEPIDIANYYRLELWKQWPVGNRHYLEADNRPEYYTFLELQYEKHNKSDAPSSTQHALDEMNAIEGSS